MTEQEKLDRITKINTLKDHTITEAAQGFEMLEGYTIQYAIPDYVYRIGEQPRIVGFTLTLKKDSRSVMQTFRFSKD